jgi:hypothetical protein
VLRDETAICASALYSAELSYLEFDPFSEKLTAIESAVRTLKVARSCEEDLHRLRVHLRMVKEDLRRVATTP